MWRVGDAGRYRQRGRDATNGVVVNGASGELVAWDRASETLKSLRCSKRVLAMCERCVHGAPPVSPKPTPRASKRRLPPSPKITGGGGGGGGALGRRERGGELTGAAALTAGEAVLPRPLRAPPPPPPPPPRTAFGLRTAIAVGAGAAGARVESRADRALVSPPPSPTRDLMKTKRRVAMPTSPSRARPRGGGGPHRSAWNSPDVREALGGGPRIAADAACHVAAELFPSGHRRAAIAPRSSLSASVVVANAPPEAPRSLRKRRPACPPPPPPPRRGRAGDGRVHQSSVLLR